MDKLSCGSLLLNDRQDKKSGPFTSICQANNGRWLEPTWSDYNGPGGRERDRCVIFDWVDGGCFGRDSRDKSEEKLEHSGVG